MTAGFGPHSGEESSNYQPQQPAVLEALMFFRYVTMVSLAQSMALLSRNMLWLFLFLTNAPYF